MAVHRKKNLAPEQNSQLNQSHLLMEGDVRAIITIFVTSHP
jgi:hypothetical protein